jgi:chitodextrinase
MPTDLTATAASASQINLAWTAATDDVGVAGYHVFRDGGTTPIVTLTGTSFADTGLTASTTHTYTVSAFDAAGNESAPSVPASATTPVSADTQPPTMPTDLTATAASASQINLAWTAATDDVGVAGYNVFRDGGATPIATVAGTSFSDTGLAPSTTHSYTVVAFDVAGNQSPLSATASATTQAAADTQPPTVPTDLTATAVSASQINLAWTAATDDVGVAGYHVFRDGGATPIATVAGTSFSDTGLAPNTTHSYTVVAFDAAGNQSSPSATAAATTLTPPATATPTAVPATSTPTTLPAATPTPAATTATLPATATPLAMTPAATPTARPAATATPRPTATKTAHPDSHREQPTVTVRVPHGIIAHGAPVVVQVRTRPGADAVITLRLTRQGTRCTGAARQRVCRPVTVVLAQRVVHVRANRQGLVTRSVALGYSPASTVRATLGVHVSTRYGAVTHTAAVLLQPAPRARHR